MYKLSIYVHCRSSPFYIRRGERSDDGNIELKLALRIEIPPRLYKWSRPSPFPPYYSYQYETIRDVVPPDPTVRHRTILHSVIGSTTTTTTTTSGLIATKLGVGIQTLDFE